jgi:hypothetical protein
MDAEMELDPSELRGTKRPAEEDVAPQKPKRIRVSFYASKSDSKQTRLIAGTRHLTRML